MSLLSEQNNLITPGSVVDGEGFDDELGDNGDGNVGHSGTNRPKLNTRGTQAVLRETQIFSLGIDHHHWLFNVLLSAIFILCHVLFVIGQVMVLWEAVIDMQISNVSIVCPGVVNTSIPDTHYHNQLRVESYASIVQGMWVQHDVNTQHPEANLKFNTQTDGRMFAGLIVLFSGCWPHCKLVATHFLWYARGNAKHRTRGMKWLEFFGKWSMVDVFAFVLVCTVFAITIKGSLRQYVASTCLMPGWMDACTHSFLLWTLARALSTTQ